MVDFKVVIRKGYMSTSSKFKITDKEENKKNKKFGGGVASMSIADKGKVKSSGGQGKNAKLNFACFIHNGPHFARECLKREKLNVILVK